MANFFWFWIAHKYGQFWIGKQTWEWPNIEWISFFLKLKVSRAVVETLRAYFTRWDCGFLKTSLGPTSKNIHHLAYLKKLERGIMVLNIEAYSGIQKLLHILFLGPLAQNWSLLKTPEEVWKILPCLERKHSFFLIIFCNLAEISSFQNIVVINNGHLSLKILLVLRYRW